MHAREPRIGRPSEEDTARWIRAARRGDKWAAESLYRAYAPGLHAVMRRIAGDDDTAADWGQEAWIRVFEALGTYRGDARFSTWLYRLAFNTAVSLRRRARRQRLEVALTATVASPSQEAAILARLDVERLLQTLPAAMRAIVVLHDIEGRTHEEIAQMLAIRPATSRSHLCKARARLQRPLGAIVRVVEDHV
jgi:RNA polymerase sigma-70 factor (ECF subfamily)